ncbi:MAG: DUF885 family protein [Thermoanaerobaculia bacterium]
MILAAALLAVSPALAPIRDAYLELYFRTFPTAAVQAGRHDHDRELEHLTPEVLGRWLAENKRTRRSLAPWLKPSPWTTEDDRLDAEALAAQIDREVHDLAVRRRPRTDPLYWTEILGNADVFLLIRDDRPEEERLAAVRARTLLIPRLAADARSAMARTPRSEIAPELCRIASGQAQAGAAFFRDGLPKFAPADAGLRRAGRRAADVLDRLEKFFDRLAHEATGSPRLGADYAATFRLSTGWPDSPEIVLAEAERDLLAKKREAALYGRSVWDQIFPGKEAPADDTTLLRSLFARAAEDRAKSTEELVDDYRNLVSRLETFLREKDIITLPDPLTLWSGPSPGFFVGQSVGGIYAAGPYSPDAKTLWFLPTPPDSATPGEKDAFFRDFNHHFNVMITPHETLPGHYVQLKYAARSPHKVRALFADRPFVEGWGTFCERLILDQGWGGALDRIAHLKKQMENIARTIADIRVHTHAMSRDDLIRFAREDALQDDQFAGNMWMRSITSAPQLTFYYLGYREVRGLFDEVRAARGADFRLREFMDGMMRLGPVPIRHSRALLGLADGSR